jgi:Uncharacterized protein conserved in bacteria
MSNFNNMTVEQRLQRSRVQMLVYYPFFGQLSMYLKFKKRNNVVTAATDGRYYYYNEDFIKSLNEKQLNFLTAHEVMHPALGHLWRKGKRDSLIFNHAADYVINAMIIECDPKGENFEMIKGGLYDPKFKGMSTEEIYEILINDKDYVKQAYENAFQPIQGIGAPIDNHDVWEEINGQDEGEDGSLDQVGETDWKERVISSAISAESKAPGTIPGSIKRLIDEIKAPQKNYKQLLAEFVQYEINDYGFSPPDKRFSHMDIILPDFSEVEEVIKWIVFVIDTSGSITNDQYQTFISEIVGCLNQFGGRVKGKLLYCDTEISEDGVYDVEDVLKSIPSGGGGTDFRPPFEWVEENMDECSGLVYLTDGDGPFPTKEPYYPVLWILTKDCEVPFGNKTRIICD